MNQLDETISINGDKTRRDILDLITDGLEPQGVELVGRYVLKQDV